MGFELTRSADKHGVPHEDAAHAVLHAMEVTDLYRDLVPPTDQDL